MAKKDDVQEQEAKKDLEAILKVHEKFEEELKTRIDILTSHDFKGSLKDTNYALTRGERKEFKSKHDLDIKMFDRFDLEQQEQLLDFLIEKRDIKDADDLSEGELLLWVQMIVYRAVNPISFEGK